MAQYRTHAQNLEVTIAMLQERIEKLENQNKKKAPKSGLFFVLIILEIIA